MFLVIFSCIYAGSNRFNAIATGIFNLMRGCSVRGICERRHTPTVRRPTRPLSLSHAGKENL